VKNGSFESGPNSWTVTGAWRVVVVPDAADGQRIIGVSSMDSRLFPSCAVMQQIALPAAGVSAKLSWKESTSGVTSTPRFSVEISGPTVPLQVVHDVSVRNPDGVAWGFHEVDLTPFLGKTITVAFWLENPTRTFCEAYVDDVRVVVEPEEVHYEVFVGRQTPLGAANLQGSTADLNWSLSGLEPGTTNYWTVHQLSDGRREAGVTYGFVVEGAFLTPPQVGLSTRVGGFELRFPTLEGVRYQTETAPFSFPPEWAGTGPEIVGNGLEAVVPLTAVVEGRMLRVKAQR
jgi:hypothetical protein